MVDAQGGNIGAKKRYQLLLRELGILQREVAQLRFPL